jgi:hypothetical protein
MGHRKPPIENDGLCTSIEPVTRQAMCEKDRGHPMPHMAHIETDDGATKAEWVDLSMIRRAMREGTSIK